MVAVTVVGTVERETFQRIDSLELPLPMVSAEAVHLWPRRRIVYSYPPPGWGWGGWGWPYGGYYGGYCQSNSTCSDPSGACSTRTSLYQPAEPYTSDPSGSSVKA